MNHTEQNERIHELKQQIDEWKRAHGTVITRNAELERLLDGESAKYEEARQKAARLEQELAAIDKELNGEHVSRIRPSKKIAELSGRLEDETTRRKAAELRASDAESTSKRHKENIIEIGAKLLKMTARAEAAEEINTNVSAKLDELLERAEKAERQAKDTKHWLEERERQLNAETMLAEAAEQKLAEYRANRITVDERAMVEVLRSGTEIYLTDDVWICCQDGKPALETVRSQEALIEGDVRAFITAGVAMLHVLNEQEGGE